MVASTVHIRRRDFTTNVALWGVGLVMLVGAVWAMAALTADVPGSTWFGPAMVGMMALLAYNGWRRGEFSSTVVTVDSGGVDVVAKPAAASWALRWEEMSVGLVRDLRDVPYVVFEPVDGMERGVRSLEERRVSALMRLPVHVRTLRFTDELRAVLEQQLPNGLVAYRL